MNENLLNCLYDAYDFLHIDNKYRTLIEQFETDTENCKNKYLQMKNEKAMVFPIYLAALYSAMICFISGGLFCGQGGVLVVVGMIFFAIGVIAMIVAGRMVKAKKKQPEKKALEFWNRVDSPTCLENESKIKQIRAEFKEFRIKNGSVLDFLPEDYQDDIQAVGYMIHVIKNGLADSLKEALHLYTEQKHRWETEAAIHGMARSMEMHNREMQGYLSEISAQQRITNSRLADIEMLTFLDYMDS